MSKKEGKAFYRCALCTTVISDWDIRSGGGCPKCASGKMSPTNLSTWEMLVQVCKHPAIWAWPEDQELLPAQNPGRNPNE